MTLSTERGRLARRKLPSAKLLRELLDYDRETGALTWRERKTKHFDADGRFSAEARRNMWNGRCAGKPAFDHLNKVGYAVGHLLGEKHLAHRVIWKIVHGVDPDTVDHINGIFSDNRLTNLREASMADQSRNKARFRNNRSGTTGVSAIRKTGMWKVYIGNGGDTLYLGVFRSLDEAIAARKSAEARFGYHQNHGREREG